MKFDQQGINQEIIQCILKILSKAERMKFRVTDHTITQSLMPPTSGLVLDPGYEHHANLSVFEHKICRMH